MTRSAAMRSVVDAWSDPRVCPRIATLTLNPAVDLACTAASVRPTHKIRTFEERVDPGGGGINVARVVRVLGGDALALIMTGGVTGRLVEELLDEAGVRWQALPIRGRTRISVTVHDRQTGLEYRFVPEGPNVEQDEWNGALNVLQETENEWIVASGSLPRGVPADFYAQAAAIASRRGRKFVLDTSGSALRAAIGHGIELLKLSLSELEFLIGREPHDPQSQEKEVASLNSCWSSPDDRGQPWAGWGDPWDKRRRQPAARGESRRVQRSRSWRQLSRRPGIRISAGCVPQGGAGTRHCCRCCLCRDLWYRPGSPS